MPTRAVALLAEAELSEQLGDRARARLAQRAADRMRRVVERAGAAVIELPGSAVLALWSSGDPEADARAGIATAARLRDELAPLGDVVDVRGAVEVVAADSPAALLAGGLGALAERQAAATSGEISIADAVVALLPQPEPGPDEPRPRAPEGEAAALLERARGSAPAPDDLPEAADERMAALFNARAWDALRTFLGPGYRQVDHRARRAEHGWGRNDVVAVWRALVAESPDAVAEVERREAWGTVALGVLRLSGTRRGRPFSTAHALLTALADDGTVAVGEVFAVGDRENARETFEALAATQPMPPEPEPEPADEAPAVDPWERHGAQLQAWRERFDAHDLEGLLALMAPDLEQVDHRDGGARSAASTHRGRESVQTMTASSFELVDDLRADVELLAVDGDRRVARIAYEAQGLRMTTYVLARLEGDLVAAQDVYDDEQDALSALGPADGRAHAGQ